MKYYEILRYLICCEIKLWNLLRYAQNMCDLDTCLGFGPVVPIVELCSSKATFFATSTERAKPQTS